MEYELIEDDVFEWDNNDYIVIDIYEYNNVKYYFTNKLLNEDEPSKEFVVFKGMKEGLIVETEKEVLDKILPYFSNMMNKRIDYLNEMKEVSNNA